MTNTKHFYYITENNKINLQMMANREKMLKNIH